MATNLALQLQVIEPDTDLNSIMIGNSRYSDDVWDLRPFIATSSTKSGRATKDNPYPLSIIR